MISPIPQTQALAPPWLKEIYRCDGLAIQPAPIRACAVTPIEVITAQRMKRKTPDCLTTMVTQVR